MSKCNYVITGCLLSAHIFDSFVYVTKSQLSGIPDLVFQQEGAPPHWSEQARADSDAIFGDAWIGRTWLDLTLDFFFWGYVKDRVYKTAVNDIDHPKERIQEAVRSVTAYMITATWGRHYEAA